MSIISDLTKVQHVQVKSGSPLCGELNVPGDKSISHRLAMLTGLADGRSTITGFLEGEDCLCTLNAMEKLGAHVTHNSDGSITVEGTGGTLCEPDESLYMGNSGTGIRLMAGLLAGYGIHATLTGDRSLSSRPMKRIKDPLEAMGAKLELTGEKGTPPISVYPAKINPIEYVLPMASAQVKSCVMLAGLCSSGDVTVVEPAPTRDHTERLFIEAGIPVEVDGLRIKMEGAGVKGPNIKARDWIVPGDFSSASFWLAAGSLSKEQSITVKGVGLNPRRTALLNVLERMGANIAITLHSKGEGEPWGDITVSGGNLKATEVFEDEISNLIDELPLVASLGALAEGKTIIRNAEELRVKETDRIEAMVVNLRRLGVTVEEFSDGMKIMCPCLLKPSESLTSFGDHRIAMSMAILAQFSDEVFEIEDVGCVATSYPLFWDHLKHLGGEVSGL